MVAQKQGMVLLHGEVKANLVGDVISLVCDTMRA